jgi:antitoxin (DNA-binding transcriptional repressor) of toxin-antitoxin stability system
MKRLSLTALRKQLYQVVDRVLETGVPVEIERHGKTLLITPVAPATSKLARLKKRRGIIGNPDTLVSVKVGEWDELRNLR